MVMCYDYEDERDSGGQVIRRRKCFCGASACLQQNMSVEINIPIEVNEDVIDERSFYKKVHA
jgi:hypothetical protein